MALLLCTGFASCSDDDESTAGEYESSHIGTAVDLGLSVKWADCNVGASAPEESGGHYAWGETKTKSLYSPETYTYNNNGEHTDIGSNISGTVYDVAHIKWGGNWRMPTQKEFYELVHNCVWKIETYNGVKGYRVKSKTRKLPTGDSVSIFLPFAGMYDTNYTDDGDIPSQLHNKDEIGYYWTSSISSDTYSYPHAYCCDISLWYRDATNVAEIYRGASVRPVTE